MALGIKFQSQVKLSIKGKDMHLLKRLVSRGPILRNQLRDTFHHRKEYIRKAKTEEIGHMEQEAEGKPEIVGKGDIKVMERQSREKVCGRFS